MNKKVEYWLNIAFYDLDTAKAMLQTQRYLYVGFMCHQAIEKALKSIIASHDEFPPKIHNLDRLADMAGLTAKLSNEQIKFIVSINPLNIESRYPTYQEGINKLLTQDVCHKIIEKTEEIVLWIKKQLK